MPNRTDDAPRTKPPVTAEPASELAASPAAPSALETADDEPLLYETFRAFFSSNQRAGRWEPADEIEVRAFCGEVTLDFTRADLPPSGVVDIEALAFWGSVEIIVPDGADVELEGTPVLGSIEQQMRKKSSGERLREWVKGERDKDLRAADEPPLFRIDCRAIMGSIKVTGR